MPQSANSLFGDKGHISKVLAELLWGNGIQMITKPRKNMKDFNISQTDKIMLGNRAIIECVNDELKNICKLQDTRHRSVGNFLMNTMGALCAYHFFLKKPSLNIVFETNDKQLLLAAQTELKLINKMGIYELFKTKASSINFEERF